MVYFLANVKINKLSSTLNWSSSNYIMIDPQIHQKYLDKVINSKEFSSSAIYQNYLKYLFDSAVQEKGLKETTIAIEFFEKRSDFNPAFDTTVRSHTYKLRKKLETYYLKEGQDDKYRLRIPKGHYKLTVIPHSEADIEGESQLIDKFLQNKYYILAIAALLLLTGYLFIRNQSIDSKLAVYEKPIEKNNIWFDYLASDLPILIVIGDHFFFHEESKLYPQLLAIRDGKINSGDDLNKFQQEHPELRLKPADEPYFPYHSVWSLPPVLSMLQQKNKRIVLRKSSSLGTQVLDEYNIIYLGSIKTLYVLNHMLMNTHISYEISPHKIIHSQPDTSSAEEIFKTSEHSPGPNDDLVIALKIPGPAKNPVFILASYHSLGTPEIANYLTNPVTRRELEKKFIEKFGEVPEFFELVFRVTGIDKTAYSTELLIFDKLNVPVD